MANLEIFRINENGAGWVDFSEATTDEKINIELGLMTKWDTIQSDLEPITPKYWGDENEFADEYDDDDLLDEQVDKYLTLDWNE